MPVKTVPFFDRHAVDTPSSETAVDVIPKKRRRNRGKGKKKVPDQAKKPELEFTRMVDGKEILNVVEKNRFSYVQNWHELTTNPPADRQATKYMLVNAEWKVRKMLETLTWKRHHDTVAIFFDLEGKNLGFNDGTTDLINIYYSPTRHEFLVYLPILGTETALDTPSSKGVTLRDLIEDGRYTKGIWDLRNDAAGLFRNLGVQIRGVVDLQLLYCSVRYDLRNRASLDVAITDRCGLSAGQLTTWLNTKTEGKALWRPESGGDFVVFQQYPLNKIVIAYCIGDIAFLPELYESLVKVLKAEQIKAIRGMSGKAAAMSRRKKYNAGFSFAKVSNPFYYGQEHCEDGHYEDP